MTHRPASDRYDRALSDAGAFLRARQNSDGSTTNVDSIWGYYSQPLALLSDGSACNWSCANRCPNFIQNNYLDDQGALRIEPFEYVGDLYPYPYLIRGACIWGRVDISIPLTRILLRFQDTCGGFYYRQGDSRLIDPAVTAHGGISLLLTGHLEQAEAAGRLLVALHDAQPDPENRYLTVWDTTAKGLFTDYGDVEDVPWGDGSQLIRDNPLGGNAYWDIGYVLAFLSSLFRVTRDREFLRVAEELFAIASQYSGFQNHVWKTPWGCAALYQATGNSHYLETALAMADEILTCQQDDGGFFLGDQSCYVDDSEQQWSYAFNDYDELRANPAILMDTAAQMMHYLGQVRAVL